MKINIVLKSLIIVLLTLIIGCNKNEDIPPQTNNSDIDKSITFNVIWDKEIEDSPSDAIFFEKYFIIKNSNDEISIFSKESGELMAKIDEKLISKNYTFDFKIKGDILYAYDNIKQIFLKYNILTKEFSKSNHIENVREFIFDDNYIYYASFDAVVKVDFELNTRDTLYVFKDTKKGYQTYAIKMGLYNTVEENKKYLVFSFMGQNEIIDRKFNVIIIDLKTNHIKLIKSFNNNDSIYKLSIKGNDLCISSIQLVYIYNFKDDNYYFVSSNHTNNFSRDVNVFSENIAEQDKKLMYYNGLEYNCYDFKNGNIEWTINNRYIEDVSNIKIKNNYYLNLLKENTLNIVDINTGKTRAIFDFKEDGEQKYFRECSDVFNENQVILRQGNNRIIKVSINKI